MSTSENVFLVQVGKDEVSISAEHGHRLEDFAHKFVNPPPHDQQAVFTLVAVTKALDRCRFTDTLDYLVQAAKQQFISHGPSDDEVGTYNTAAALALRDLYFILTREFGETRYNGVKRGRKYEAHRAYQTGLIQVVLDVLQPLLPEEDDEVEDAV